LAPLTDTAESVTGFKPTPCQSELINFSLIFPSHWSQFAPIGFFLFDLTQNKRECSVVPHPVTQSSRDQLEGVGQSTQFAYDV
jgi:hypothetical protein